MKHLLFILLSIGIQTFSFSQEEDIVIKDSIYNAQIHEAALKPSKAAFYSAIVPGLGQAYNKKYWKIPIVYGSLAAGYYFYDFNNTKFHDYRDMFKEKKIDPNTYPDYSLDQLQRAQKYHKKDRDLSIMLTIGMYVLQIVEASVDAHLQFHNTDNNLGFTPKIIQEPITGKSNIAGSLTFNF